MRDVAEVAKEMIANENFTGDWIFKNEQVLMYVPGQLVLNTSPTNMDRYTSTGEREISSLCNADWLLELKQQLPCGTWICPVVWASDKTNITNTGRSAYPVYMTLGSLGIDRR